MQTTDTPLPLEGKEILLDFTHFSRLEFCTLMDNENRLFKANIYCIWQFARIYALQKKKKTKKKQSSDTIYREIK